MSEESQTLDLWRHLTSETALIAFKIEGKSIQLNIKCSDDWRKFKLTEIKKGRKK